MRTLRNRNIVLFYGGGVTAEGPFLVTEFCSRGTVRDILGNAGIELSWSKRVGFAIDAAAGMKFLHTLEPPCIHRDLKSMNLLVNDNWIVKVSDFGTARIYATCDRPGLQHGSRASTTASRASSLSPQSSGYESRKSANSHHSHHASLDDSKALTKGVGTLLWTAPEILRGEHYDKAADVYSFAIVMWELMWRTMPYADYTTRWDIERAVKAGTRPPVDPTSPAAFAKLMEDCWSDDASTRPSFVALVPTLEDLSEALESLEPSATDTP
eukprot:m.633014 g.633014  ORF g.633014 m.633014 type:complete len:269 (+) comp58295_c0_seq10:2883-3689(+)